ncbi:uncharacterized protein LOC120896642 [Anopheles arabiensis]|uniref:uncharacterized protein LOC120896642 n=1 Tax=Anopheles arabiensis TaxID=7173 RepID=UPI001AADEC61|nr:uncharacterized protein LOC120896642 [Anopheles arabiensis]
MAYQQIDCYRNKHNTTNSRQNGATKNTDCCTCIQRYQTILLSISLCSNQPPLKLRCLLTMVSVTGIFLLWDVCIYPYWCAQILLSLFRPFQHASQQYVPKAIGLRLLQIFAFPVDPETLHVGL